MQGYEDAINIIKEYEDITKTNKRNVIFFAYQQGKVSRKFKKNRKFKNFVGRFEK